MLLYANENTCIHIEMHLRDQELANLTFKQYLNTYFNFVVVHRHTLTALKCQTREFRGECYSFKGPISWKNEDFFTFLE